MGHRIGTDGIKPSLDKVKVILANLRPTEGDAGKPPTN